MNFRQAIILVLIGEGTLIILGIIHYGISIDAWQAATRYSGRLSLLLFSIMFLYQYKESSYAWLSPKPYHVFALAHGIHLIELLTFVYFSRIDLNLLSLAGGFLAYVLIFIMPYFADRRAQGMMHTPSFRLIQTIYQYYVWLIFFMTYLARVRGTALHVGGSYGEHVALLGWVSLLLGMKLPQLMRKESDRK